MTATTPLTLKDQFQTYVQAQIPRVLTQLDRDPDSPTFGCFDRNYWHYKIRDFPSAILQQGLFTLEAIRTSNEGLEADAEVIQKWCVAAVNALARQIDRQGSVDEYYPFERSYPAAAFSLYAICRVLWDWQTTAPALMKAVELAPLQRLVNHLAGRRETQAVNQQVAGLAGLALAAQLDGLSVPEPALAQLATQLFDSQGSEGWFNEYGGPDFGYLTVTLDTLADYYEATGDRRALAASDRGIEFLAKLVGADGRLPTTLNSRNTDYVVPYGLVRAAARNPLATWLVETLFQSLGDSSHPTWATDDRYHAHYIFASVIRSLPHLEAMLPAQAPTPKAELWLPDCGFWIYWSPDRRWTAYVGAHKGGLVRIHRLGQPPLIETGWRIHQGHHLWTSHWWSSDWQVQKDTQQISIQGPCQKAAFHLPTPVKHGILRLLAWIFHDKLIPLLKQQMIFRAGSAKVPGFERRVQIDDYAVVIQDRITALPGAIARPSPRQNLRHVASADSFSPEEWQPSLLGSQSYPLETELVVETVWNASPDRP